MRLLRRRCSAASDRPFSSSMTRAIPYTDADIDAYAQHVAKLAAIAAPNDPASPSFRVWFYWRYGAMPLDTVASDRHRRQAQQQEGPAAA